MSYSLKELREEHRLRVSENRVLRRIFRPKREEVIGGENLDTCAVLFPTYFSTFFLHLKYKCIRSS
jgi:hypothetical protein